MENLTISAERDHNKVEGLGKDNSSASLKACAERLESSIEFHFKEMAYHGDSGLHTTQIMLKTKELCEVKGALFIAIKREEQEKIEEDAMWEAACKGGK